MLPLHFAFKHASNIDGTCWENKIHGGSTAETKHA
jgi:hypothetical protein